MYPSRSASDLLIQANGYVYSIPGVLYMFAVFATVIRIDSDVEGFDLDGSDPPTLGAESLNSELSTQKYWSLTTV
jgi:hypothetical protein